MLSLDNMRKEFSDFLSNDPAGRWRMDAALAHVVTIAYNKGLEDACQTPIDTSVNSCDTIAPTERPR